MRKIKRKVQENTSMVVDEDEEARKLIPAERKSDEPPTKKVRRIFIVLIPSPKFLTDFTVPLTGTKLYFDKSWFTRREIQMFSLY